MPPRNPDLQREQSNHPREFADFVYAYPVVSRRSGGVSIGVNLNLDKFCNFDCPYCQVDRTVTQAQAGHFRFRHPRRTGKAAGRLR